MNISGNISKMKTSIENDEVVYELRLNNELVNISELVGKTITLEYQNQINCIACGKKTSKSFAQGFCYNCFQTAPQAEECVLKPETCRAHLGEARDIEFAEAHCLIPHYVYLAIASGVKVGITRHTQIPTRWIDQGASKAIIIAEVPNRHIAGVMEVHLKQYFADKTNWRAMLKNVVANDIDIASEKLKAIEHLPDELKQYVMADAKEWTLNYPVETYPLKPQSLTFDKEAKISGTLKGIKGQYLLLDNDRVLNIRKHNGYLVSVQAD
ncbi:DUF2797 domain-containing protein [Carboxylicivirga sp. M1479]|uniref:DUF2797 domain-containing protein n=1 Tax=Carboxylicivirga sp. M1479 TaxID=2594476 RepID=UPI0011774D46|nr:DUF2797 domain-containing protein [Carboxylicivirga sp. M1479]TRX66241.1 DUF2797 domain-containing protein [Carboxylicivirga sp. M1479]